MMMMIMIMTQAKLIQRDMLLGQMLNANFHYVGKYFLSSHDVAHYEATFRIPLYKYIEQSELIFDFGVFDHSHWKMYTFRIMIKSSTRSLM